jgi:hypothetical protein
VREKEQLELPLFCLATEEQYQVTRAIMNRVANPYLQFANSPEEIRLCMPLFRCNPSLGAAALSRHHFETLLLAERAREELSELRNLLQAAQQSCRPQEDTPGERCGGEPSRLSTLRERAARLEAFVARIEAPNNPV